MKRGRDHLAFTVFDKNVLNQSAIFMSCAILMEMEIVCIYIHIFECEYEYENDSKVT
jgi:hypothetical protein